MAVLPAAAAAAYQSVAKMGGSAAGTTAASPADPASSFGNFLSNAIKDSADTIRNGEKLATQHLAGRADIVDVVNAVNQAEITLNTVVAVRDKVVAAYQSIMNMPI